MESSHSYGLLVAELDSAMKRKQALLEKRRGSQTQTLAENADLSKI